MNRLKRMTRKAEGEFTYIAKSPVIISHEGYERREDEYELRQADHEEHRNLKQAVYEDLRDEGQEGLAKYLDKPLSDFITSIIVDVDDTGAATVITSTKELEVGEIELLKEYLTGQYSDGWGEGFEQRELYDYSQQYESEEYDEEDDEHYTDTFNEKVYVYAHFWNSKNFNMTIERK